MADTKPQVLATAGETILSTNGLPQGRVDVTRWWKQKNLRSLNLWLLIPLLSIFAQGQVLPNYTIYTA